MLQDAGHGERFTVERDGLADDIGIGAERAFPETIAENGHGGFAGFVLLRQQQAAKQGLCTEHVEQAGLCSHAIDEFGLLTASQREGAALGEGHLLEGVVFVLDVNVLAWRGPVAENADGGRMEPYGSEAVRLRIGERTQ